MQGKFLFNLKKFIFIYIVIKYMSYIILYIKLLNLSIKNINILNPKILKNINKIGWRNGMEDAHILKMDI